jgi:hypothetical protein
MQKFIRAGVWSLVLGTVTVCSSWAQDATAALGEAAGGSAGTLVEQNVGGGIEGIAGSGLGGAEGTLVVANLIDRPTRLALPLPPPPPRLPPPPGFRERPGYGGGYDRGYDRGRHRGWYRHHRHPRPHHYRRYYRRY